VVDESGGENRRGGRMLQRHGGGKRGFCSVKDILHVGSSGELARIFAGVSERLKLRAILGKKWR
jgi:hypothetical protein